MHQGSIHGPWDILEVIDPSVVESYFQELLLWIIADRVDVR